MALGSQPRWTVRPADGARVDIDVGLRQYMLKVYNYMTGGLVLTGVIAYFVANSPTILHAIYGTPLQWVVDSDPRVDTLAFQIDLWSAEGELPRNLADADLRGKDIRFSSRTRAATDLYKYTQKLRIAFATLLNISLIGFALYRAAQWGRTRLLSWHTTEA